MKGNRKVFVVVLSVAIEKKSQSRNEMIEKIDNFIERFYWPGIAFTVVYFAWQALR